MIGMHNLVMPKNVREKYPMHIVARLMSEHDNQRVTAKLIDVPSAGLSAHLSRNFDVVIKRVHDYVYVGKKGTIYEGEVYK